MHQHGLGRARKPGPQTPGQAGSSPSMELRGMCEGQRFGLVRHTLNDFVYAMSDVGDGCPTDGIEVSFSTFVKQVHTLATDRIRVMTPESPWENSISVRIHVESPSPQDRLPNLLPFVDPIPLSFSFGKTFYLLSFSCLRVKFASDFSKTKT